MSKDTRMKELIRLQTQVDMLRAELGISSPGAILFQDFGEDKIIVEADGFGRATTSIVEGNYPIDYCTKFEKRFRTEQDAESAAHAMGNGKLSPSRVLGARA